jgi:hypothetical protein
LATTILIQKNPVSIRIYDSMCFSALLISGEERKFREGKGKRRSRFIPVFLREFHRTDKVLQNTI